ncbi:hypothetical protein EGY14_24245 [Burkholderia pseudomallei]|nr:hypothetical protein EGY14_24245 [Burkholderia pseudomallei]
MSGGHEWGRGAERIARPARAARFALHAAPWPRGGLNGNRSARGGRYGVTDRTGHSGRKRAEAGDAAGVQARVAPAPRGRLAARA